MGLEPSGPSVPALTTAVTTARAKSNSGPGGEPSRLAGILPPGTISGQVPVRTSPRDPHRRLKKRMEDAAAVAQARAGDHDAFAVVVERHSHALFQLAYRMTGNE